MFRNTARKMIVTNIARHQNLEKCRMRSKFEFLVPTHLLYHYRPRLYLLWYVIDQVGLD